MLRMDRDSNAIVEALSGEYMSIYTIEPETGRYREYCVASAYKQLGLSSGGDDFFRQFANEMEKVVNPDDLHKFRERFTKENIFKDLGEKGSFHLPYILMINGEQKPVSIKITLSNRLDSEKLIAGIREWKERKQK